ncbi:MAG: trypsin-like peptidase domain-containing protein [Chloroflexota bacterium]
MSNTLQEMSNGLASVVETVGPGIVRVEGRRRMPASGIVWSEDGLIVSANHVVKRDEGIKIGLADGSVVSAKLVGRDTTTDLALLQSDAKLSKPNWAGADADTLGVGHIALALGRPGKTVQATMGVISALSEGNWRTPAGGMLDRYLQTDVVMYPGFSGGPLADVNGQVLGLNSSSLMRGVSLAAPTATINRVAATLAAHGHIKRGYIGVSTQPVRIPDTLKEEAGQETGLLLVAVDEAGPAGEGALVLGDTIIGMDDTAVHSYEDLVTLLTGDRIGQEASFRIIRGGQIQESSLTIGSKK